MPSDTDFIRVPKARLREVKDENETLHQTLKALQEEHESLRAHLKGSIQEVARLKEANQSLRNQLDAQTA